MDPKTVKHTARTLLDRAACDPKKIALLFAGVSAAFSLVCSLLSWLLGLAMDHTGGLSGLALRSMLESGQVMLSLASSLLLPFWQIGFVFAALCYSKEAPVENRTLLEGFRRWGAVLRLNILLILVISGMMMVCSYLAMMVFFLSPFSDRLYENMQSLVDNAPSPELTEEMVWQLLPNMGWCLALFVVVLLVVGLPFFYRYRLSEFALMDGAPGALAAIRESKRLSWNRRMGLFKLDLSFWWYHLLQMLTGMIASIGTVLPDLGVKLPISPSVAFWVFYILGLGLQFLLTWRFAAHYQTSFALYYKQIKEYTPPAPQPPVQPE